MKMRCKHGLDALRKCPECDADFDKKFATPKAQAEAMAREIVDSYFRESHTTNSGTHQLIAYISTALEKLMAENESAKKETEAAIRECVERGVERDNLLAENESKDAALQTALAEVRRLHEAYPRLSQLTATEARLKESEAHVSKLKCRNLINALESICAVCGHTITEDGCAFCIRETIAPLMEILNRRVGDEQSGYCGTVMVDDKLKDELNKSRAFLSTLTAEKKDYTPPPVEEPHWDCPKCGCCNRFYKAGDGSKTSRAPCSECGAEKKEEAK